MNQLSKQGRSQHFRYRGAKGITRAKRAPIVRNASTLNTSWAEPDLKKEGASASFAPPIDHFRYELFINPASGSESRTRHAEYLPRPIVG